MSKLRKFSLIGALLVTLFTVNLSAQTTQMATLLHDGNVSIFYGANALNMAYNAAVDDDVITLSAGQFDAVAEMRKSITIRGAGLDLKNFKTGNIATVINGKTTIYSSKIRLEGLDFKSHVSYYKSVKEVYAEKCKFYSYHYYNYKDCFPVTTFINCIGDIDFNGSTNTAINCVFYNIPTNYYNGAHSSYGNYLNCIFTINNASITISLGSFQNCIFIHTGNGDLKIGSTTQTHNCLFVGKNGGYSFGSVHATDRIRQDITTPFKDGTYYELLEEFNDFVTSDGTQVGIYGGTIGFSQTPNIPQINKFKVSPRTSADGKLSVEIEVKGIE